MTGIKSADMFLMRALEKILSDKEIKKSQHVNLKKQFEVALDELKKDAKILQQNATASTNGETVISTDKYLIPFEQACKAKSTKIVETALDCLQKLIAHGYLNDSTNAELKQQLANRITRTICACFEGPHVEDSVQLQIIKCLLTILTSPHFEVHDNCMLMPIKTCYNIHISSKSLVNQASARAALTQIINTILQRFDTAYEKRKQQQHELLKKQQELNELQKRQQRKSVDDSLLNHSTNNGNNDTISINSESADSTLTSNTTLIYDRYVQIIHDCLSINLNDQPPQQQQQPTQPYSLEHDFDAHSIGTNAPESAYDEIADLMINMIETVVKNVAKGECDLEMMSQQNNENQQAALQQQQQQQQQGQLNDTEKGGQNTNSASSSKDPEVAQILDTFERDAFLMFRAFCRLSQRPIADTATIDIKTNIEAKSKILSLQLILNTLQNAKQSFKENRHIINVIRKYLCVSLSKNGVSPINEVFEFSLAIFVALLADYKQYLKKQMEIFFREIIIYLLESQTSSFDQKWLVIQALTHICANAQCVVDLYVNYDCDLQSTNVFARLVEILSKIAQGRQAIEIGCTMIQVKNIRLKGLECLVSILKCMVEWCKDLYVNPHSQSNLGPENRPVDADSIDINQQKIKSYDSENSLNSTGNTVSSLLSNSQPIDWVSYNPDELELLKHKKELWEHGIELFNKKPNKGIQYLQEHQLLGHTADEIAEFFHREERLNKTTIGDFLGENEKFHKEVMYAYVDQMDFNNMEIVSALRYFLEGFRLPGEAQKIDRLMEKFAHRYHECNKRLHDSYSSANSNTNADQTKIKYYFENADAVYVCAFSVIMLATDLHSSQVKRKMTKDDYVKMNRGINDSKDLPREFLDQIYDLVAESELKLKSDITVKHHKSRTETVTNEKHRRLLYNMEIEQVTQTARALMESMYHVQQNFTSATYGQHIKPMFKIAWTPFLAAFSVALQDSDDVKVTELCLNGIRCALRLACIFHLELERDAYVQALARFTLLTATSPITEMKSKNVECIKTLITVAQTDGNYLGSSWHEILKCISQLEYAQSIGNNVKQKLSATHAHANSSTYSINSTSSSGYGSIANSGFALDLVTQRDGIDQKTLQNIQQQIGETVSQSVVVAVDRIFTGSVRLDGDAINEFVKCLCSVSVDELSATPPRMYSLQKIVEISYYNMGRIRLQWTRIWSIIGEHFNKAGCNPNVDVAFFAVDSLRQLAMKFLEKGEFANFRFQKDFLKPFEHIMKRNNSQDIKDMVVQCIGQMVKSQSHNIKSGWKNIFSVFHIAASSNIERIVVMAFETMTDIIRNVADKYFLSMLDSFQDAIKCLSEFACNSSSPDISIEAIGLIRHCAVFVAEKPRVFAEHSNDDLKNVPEEDRVWVKGWFPILFELSCIINRCKLDVRTRGLTVMFEIMKTYGESFIGRWWKDLFNVVFRIFDNMKLPEAHIEKAEWMTTTCNHALYAIIDVFSQHFEIMSPILIEDLYAQLKWCVKQDNEQLARSGTNCLETFVNTNGEKFNEKIWKQTCECILEIFNFTIPYNLLTWTPDATDSSNTSFNDTESYHDDSFHQQTHHPQQNHQQHQQQQQQHQQQRNKTRTTSVTSLNSSYSEDISTKNTKIPHNKVPDMEHRVFHSLLIKCVVQLELIQTIDNIVFYPSTSKKEDASYFAAAQALSTPTSNGTHHMLFSDDQTTNGGNEGMYSRLNNEQLFLLIDCLNKSYDFARTFNSNAEQRNILWKAGFKGKDKPNLLKHETQSLACMLRILFKMLNDEKRKTFCKNTQDRLIKLSQEALDYYLMLPSESHRESWDHIILLLINKLIKLEIDKFKTFSSELYRQLCDILTFNLKPELRNMLREFFIHTGSVYINNK